MSTFERIKKGIVRIEPFLFYTACLLMLLPLFRFQFFPTCDGPAHVYNANLIDQKLFHPNAELSKYFSFNSEPVPNWICHLIMGFFRLFCSASLSEKMFQLIYVLGLSLSFRRLVKSFGGSLWFTWLAFPFVFNFLFMFGFYNFSFAIVFMLIAMRYWRENSSALSLKKAAVLSLLITLTYFSHIFVFTLLGLFILLDIAFEIIRDRFSDKSQNLKAILKIHFKKSIWLFCAALPSITLFLWYYLSRKVEYEKFIESDILLHWLSVMYPFSGYSGDEYPYSQSLAYIIFGLFVAGLVYTLHNLSNKKGNDFFKTLFSASTVFLFISTILMFLYFKMPDENSYGGIVSPRVLLLSVMFLVLWINTIRLPGHLFLLVIPLTLYLTWNILDTRRVYGDHLAEVAEEVSGISEHVKPYSTVVPFNYDDPWLAGHIFSYLACEKPMILLANYEASTGYFPLCWNFPAMPDIMIGKMRDGEVEGKIWTTNHESTVKEQADYVFLVGDRYREKPDTFSKTLLRNLESYYTLIKRGKYARLFISNSLLTKEDMNKLPKQSLSDKLHGKKFYLKPASDSNLYIVTSPPENKLIKASAGALIEITGFQENNVAFKFSNGKFLCADLALNGELFANRSYAGPWETFTLEAQAGGLYTIKASNGKFVSAANGFFAVSNSVSQNETFILVPDSLR